MDDDDDRKEIKVRQFRVLCENCFNDGRGERGED
jgi:hypothetical protein